VQPKEDAIGIAKVFPCLWFDRNAEEAAEFYVTLLPDSHVDNVWRSLAQTPSGPAGMVLTVDFTVAGQQLQGAVDMGPPFDGGLTPALRASDGVLDDSGVPGDAVGPEDRGAG
jgi:predicted 3-demethylubiquinone-9 3-methyltransferase (glyoxalase superfamily)